MQIAVIYAVTKRESESKGYIYLNLVYFSLVVV
jgi:hypothetical protein